jgi:DNA repair exonuclease SbcCD ATPase subunit
MLNGLAEDHGRRLAVANRIQQQLESAKGRRRSSESELELEEKAQQVLLALEEVWRKDFERNIEEIITEGIQLVFGDDLDFIVETKVERGASAIEFFIERNESTIDIDSDGGSMVQVVSFILRLILIKAHRPQLRQFVAIDEAFNGVDENHMPAVGSLLRKMVDESRVQILFVTHNPVFIEYADVVYEITKNKGVASGVRL